MEGRGRLLVVQKTGWGKSLVYFIATKLLREQGSGPALLISPLLALMRNQIAAAGRMGVRARTIHSENQEDWGQVEAAISRDEVDILLISPERLANEHFQSRVLGPMAGRIVLLVVDEAHCISDWGHDFRPLYRLLERIIRGLPPHLRLLATTATANNRVLQDLESVLGPDLTTSRGGLSRPSLFLQTIRMQGQAERLAWLATQVAALPGHGIIYTLTVRDAELVAAWLRSRGLDVEAYSAATAERRPELEDALLNNRLKALVATTALGMGFDKPDLAFVIHYQTPGSVIAYYQQVGRAGRRSRPPTACCSAAWRRRTSPITSSRAPSRRARKSGRSWTRWRPHPAGCPCRRCSARSTSARRGPRRRVQLLALESPSPIAKQGSRWMLAASELSDEFWRRAERLTALRRVEQTQMQEYVDLESGHMEFLIRALDGPPDAFRPPGIPRLPTTPDPDVVREAAAFLRRTNLPLEPRKMWPTGGLPLMGVAGQIEEERRARPGKVLCVWGDAGWGALVRRGKSQDKRFSDEVVGACVALFREWAPQPPPAWVTCIPSRRHPDLVPDFARASPRPWVCRSARPSRRSTTAPCRRPWPTASSRRGTWMDPSP